MAELRDFAPFDLAHVLGRVEAIKAARENIADAQTERGIKHHEIASQLARNIVSRMAQHPDLKPGTPEFQAQLERYGRPAADMLRQIGAPTQEGPIHWDSLQTLAAGGGGLGPKVARTIEVDNGDGTASYYNVLSDNTTANLNLRVPASNLGQGMMAVTDSQGNRRITPIPGAIEAAKELERQKKEATEGERIETLETSTGAHVPFRLKDVTSGAIPVGPGNGRPQVTATFSTPEGAAGAMELARTMPAGPERDALVQAAGAALVRKGQQPGQTPGIGFSAADKSRIAVEQARQEAEIKAEVERRVGVETERLKAEARESGKSAGEKAAEAPQRLRLLDNRLADIDAAIGALEPSAETTQFGMPKSFGFHAGGFLGGGGINPANSAMAMEFTNDPNWRTLQRVGKGEELSRAAEDMAKQGQITEGERALLMLATGLDPAKHRSEQIYQQLMVARARLQQLRKQWEKAGAAASSPTVPTAPTAPKIPRVSSHEEIDKLPAGAHFITPDGVERVK